MTKTARRYVIFIGTLSICIIGWMTVNFARDIRQWRDLGSPREEGTVIREPDAPTDNALVRSAENEQLPNIAPFATVTVSSVDESRRSAGRGVADGTVDEQEWMSLRQHAGAWIMLDWGKPVLVDEVDLYDRLSLEENVLGGVLTFDDGTIVAVGPLPSDGTPAQIKVTPKAVSWLMFRIDSVQGRDAGLAEIMVHGLLNP